MKTQNADYLIVKSMVYFNVEMKDNINMRKDKQNVCAAARFFVLRAVFGIFWPEGGRRPSEGQKNPKNGPKAKKSWLKHKTIFLSFRMVINVLH